MRDSDYPALYRAASELSQNAQQAFYRIFAAHMGLLVLAAAITVLESHNIALAIFQALILLGALGCAIYLSAIRPERQWYGGRAIAESIKTITWRYLSRSEPFSLGDNADIDLFRRRLKLITEQNREIAKQFSTHLSGLQITEEMARVRQLPTQGRISYYREGRIEDQLHWYSGKAKYNRTKVKVFFGLLISTIVLAIVCSISKIGYPTATIWPTDVFVIIAASLLSWIQAKRFQELSASYALTAHEISFVREQSRMSMTDEEFSVFVGDAENAFSREHTQWIARMDI